MMIGTLVHFGLDYTLKNPSMGIVVRELDWSEKLGDPFPMYEVLFHDRGLLKCRASDLRPVEGWGLERVDDTDEQE